MTLWSVILLDRGGVVESFLQRLRERMRALGSRRVPFKGGAFWDYKPDLRPGPESRAIACASHVIERGIHGPSSDVLGLLYVRDQRPARHAFTRRAAARA